MNQPQWYERLTEQDFVEAAQPTPTIDPRKIQAAIVIRQKYRTMTAIREALAREGVTVPKGFNWKSGKLDNTSFMGWLAKNLTLEQLEWIKNMPNIASATQYATAKVQTLPKTGPVTPNSQAWSNEIQRLTTDLNVSRANVEQVTRGFVQCLRTNIADPVAVNNVVECMLNLIQSIENREKIAALLVEGITAAQ